MLKSWSYPARIAQGIERLPPEQKAVGSIPTAGTESLTFLCRFAPAVNLSEVGNVHQEKPAVQSATTHCDTPDIVQRNVH